VLTGDSSGEVRDAALAAGARDFLTKPYDAGEVILRVRNLIETRLLHVELQRQNAALSERFESRTEELEAAKLEILERLARAADFRDESSYGHTTRVGELAARIAAQMGLTEAEVDQIRIAARLHDIGKIGVSDSILMKPGRLAPAEFLAQEKHTLIGANILSGSRFPVLRLAEDIALTHHECWDGTGYPRGLQQEEIPLCGRIVAVADVFDALTHTRVYKSAWRLNDAVEEIKHQRGKKFDPAVVDAFLAIAAGYVDTDELEAREPHIQLSATIAA
jgi:putative two-component system response regulator